MPPHLIAALLVLAPLPAFAHHPMGGTVPATVWEGFASGIGHPVLGLDHLAFLLAAGVLAAMLPARRGVAAILAFVAAAFLGTSVHVAGIGLGPVELAVALSVLAAGLVLGLGVVPRHLPAFFFLAGLFHGHAFAEAIIGAEPTPVFAYLAALALMQAALGIGAMAVSRRLIAAGRGVVLNRATGATVAGIGWVFLVLATLG